MNDKRKEYYALVGEFIHLCAQIELSITSCSILVENHPMDRENVSVVLKIEKKLRDDFYTKIKNIDSKLKFPKQNNKPEGLDDIWLHLRREALELMNERNFLVHGTGLYNFFVEPVKATIVEHNKKELTTKEYYLSDIESLIVRARHLLAGENGLETKFIHLYGAWITGKPFWLRLYRVEG